MNIEERRTADLIPYANNPRDNEKAVDAVAESIIQFGFKVPIVVDRGGVIIAGHTRAKAANKLGLETVPVIVADDLTEEQVTAFRLADNKVSEKATWNEELLIEELRKCGEFNMEALGFDMDILDKGAEDILQDDIPEPPKKAETKLGQIWQLGRHRLICGDSTDPETIARLTEGTEMDLWITDPPYNVALGQNGGHVLRPSEAKQLHRRTDGLAIENDAWQNDREFINFLHKAFEAAMTAVKPGGVFYIWYADTQALNFRLAAQEANLEVRQNLIWVKSVFALGRQDYQWRHEPCLYGWKEGAAHYFVNDRTQSTITEDGLDIDHMKKEEMRDLLKKILTEEPTTALYFDKPSRSAEHPTMKPVQLFAKQIENSTKPGDKVIDTFGGSGTTLICAEQLGRTAYIVELDPHYCDVIKKRWENLTGEEATLLEVEHGDE